MYQLIPPSVKEPPAGMPPLFNRYGLLRGISLLVSWEDTVAQVRYPTEDQLAVSRIAYIGGHEYLVEDDEAQVLIDAGYGDCLYVQDRYVDEYVDVY